MFIQGIIRTSWQFCRHMKVIDMCFSVKKTGKCHSFTFVCAEVDVPLLEWEYLPPIGPRPLKGFVGLKNAGATCYMNSLLQQLFMIDEIRSSILQVEGAAHDNMDDYDDEKLEVEVSVTSLIELFVAFACKFKLHAKRMIVFHEIELTVVCIHLCT